MTRWIAAPLIAAVALGGSGFLDSLERTVEASIALARSSENAPERSRAGAEEVEDLPEVAELTDQQAQAFAALADALQVSAERVVALNESVGSQVGGLEALRGSLESLDPAVACIRTRIGRLVRITAPTAGILVDVSASLARITAAQDKSLRHLKSINRKLTALGVVATATDVEAPKPPGGAPAPEAGDAPGPRACRG